MKTKDNQSEDVENSTPPAAIAQTGADAAKALRPGGVHKNSHGEILRRQVLGIPKRTLEAFKYISDRFELLLRSNNLSWNHHYEVASLKQIRENGNKLLKSHDVVTI